MSSPPSRRESPRRRCAAWCALAILLTSGCGDLGSGRDNVSGGPGSVVARDGGSGADRGRDAVSDQAGDARGEEVALVDGATVDVALELGAADGSGAADGPPPGLSAACASCEMTSCTADAPDFLDIADGVDWYAACFSVTGKATSGPASGTPKKDLCQAVVDCVHRTQCDPLKNGKASLIDCYCGPGTYGDDALQQACFGGSASGPCKTEIINASETSVPSEVPTRAFYDSDYASGAALGFIQYCETPTNYSNKLTGAPCQQECYGFLSPGTGGTGGAGGTGGPGGGSGAASGGSGGGPGGGGNPGTGGRIGGSGGNRGTGGGCVDSTAPLFLQAEFTCQSCELASTLESCSPNHLTAQHDTDPDTGDPIAVGWGTDTLPTQAERDAAAALVRRIGAKSCSTNSTNTAPGVYPQLGCLLGSGQPLSNVYSGIFADPAVSAVNEYKAAAVASGLRPTAGSSPLTAASSNADFGNAIAIAAVDEGNAVGLADNIAHCALEAACAVCFDDAMGGGGVASGGAAGVGGLASGGTGGTTSTPCNASTGGGMSTGGGASAGGGPSSGGGPSGSSSTGGNVGSGGTPVAGTGGGRAGTGGTGGLGTGGNRAGTGGAGTGGAATGGASSGGAATGGASSGGAATGGAATGGASSGGAATGGASTGGASTGGAGTGGASTGGAGSGGGVATPGGCPDLNRDGLPDCLQSLVENPDFNLSTASWSAEPGGSLSWNPTDGGARAQSGSMGVTNSDTSPAHASDGATTVGALQCLPVTVGLGYQVGAQVYLAAGQGGGAAGFVIDYYFSQDCVGGPWSQPFVSSRITTTGTWQSLVATTTQIPIGILSIAVRLVAVKPVAQPSLQVLFDNVLVVVK